MKQRFDNLKSPINAHRIQEFAQRSKLHLIIVIGLLTLVIIGLPNWGIELIKWLGTSDPLGIPAAASAAILMLSVYLLALWLLSEIARMAMWSSVTRVEAIDSKAQGLIMALSDPSQKVRTTDLQKLEGLKAQAKADAQSHIELVKKAFAQKGLLYALSNQEIENANFNKKQIEAIRTYLNWQQSIRAIAYHHEKLRHVRILLSAESLVYWEDFKAMVSALFPNHQFSLDYVKAPDGTPYHIGSHGNEELCRDLEEYSFVRNGISKGVNELTSVLEEVADKHLGTYRPRKICVDITAGNKMSSIAGAIVTLNRDLMVSYVNNEGEYSVYQARIGLADSLTRSLSG
jgi:hypothetical protein